MPTSERNGKGAVEPPLTRRTFVKGSALMGLTAAAAGTGIVTMFSGCSVQDATTQSDDSNENGEKVVWGHCSPNCYGRCALRLHVRDDEVCWVEADSVGKDEYGDHQIRACLRGRSYRRFMNHPDRLKYPMKRVGERGSGEFERISWEEATQLICDNYVRIRDEYGPASIYRHNATGVMAWNINHFLVRFLCINGGYLPYYGGYSAAQSKEAMPYTYGTRTNNTTSDIANTKLLVMFGENAAVTKMGGGGASYHIAKGLEKSGARCVIIDPRYSDTVATYADEWIPIRPNTDAAMVDAMAYVMISENLVDQDFIDTYCVGYDEKTMPEGVDASEGYKAYILGEGKDGVAKTPAWASEITHVPEETIVRLAREIATTKPCFVLQGLGPQRHTNGEQTSRAIQMLAILTGNVGKSGGGTGGFHGTYTITDMSVPSPENAVKAEIPTFMWSEGVDHGHLMTAKNAGIKGTEELGTDIKFVWNYGGNSITNQHGNINRVKEILKDETKCEFIVVWDVFMTDSAKYADVLLPDLLPVEQPNYVNSEYNGNMAYIILGQAATSPKFERKSLYACLTEFSKYLGNEEEFTEGKTEEEWLPELYEMVREAEAEKGEELPTYEELLEMGVYRKLCPKGESIALEAFVKDPEANPLKTESGKIEIYSSALARIAETWELAEGEVINPLPVYADCPESWSDPLKETYPLQMFAFHPKSRTHSSFGCIELLDESIRQRLWINPRDASSRGIEDGALVHVFNDRGTVQVEAKVTNRIMPGVVAMAEGAWHREDANGIDIGGCMNTLTSSRPSPLAKGSSLHTNLVNVRMA